MTVTGLTNGTTYTFRVTATNSVGPGPASAPSNAVTPATVPGAPMSVNAVAGNTQATVSFAAPASNGGAAITSYTITPFIGATAQPSTIGAGSPVTVTGLTNGTTYTFTVTATNSVGSGPASGPSNAVTPTIAVGITVDTSVFSDGTGTRTATLTTAGTNRLILTFCSSDGPSSGGQRLTVAGGGLAWTLVRRVNTRLGSSEIWRAFASAALSNASISLTQLRTGYHQSLTVVAFSGATGVGASNTANGASGQPTVNVTTTRAGSLVYGVGNDWDRAVVRTVPADQTKVHEWVDVTAGDTFWVQAHSGAVPEAGMAVTLNDTAPINDRWNFAIVEIVQ